MAARHEPPGSAPTWRQPDPDPDPDPDSDSEAQPDPDPDPDPDTHPNPDRLAHWIAGCGFRRRVGRLPDASAHARKIRKRRGHDVGWIDADS
jgi:hypothetical protein